MNFGGFSWRRLLGISAFKSRISRKIGIPLTASGRRRKLGAFIFNAVGPVAGTLAVAAVGATKRAKGQSKRARGQSPSLDPISAIQAIQAEVKETAEKEGWGFTYVYFENAERGLYRIVQAEDTEYMRQALHEGMIRVGFIGTQDAPKGILFGFALDDSFPMNGIVAKRFMVNAREWVVTTSKDLCAQKGTAAPIVHDVEFSKQFVNTQFEGATQNVAAVLGIAGLLLGLFTGAWRMAVVIVLFAGFIYGDVQGLVTRLVIALIFSCLIYRAWWAAGVVTAATVACLVWSVSRSAGKGAR